jgi:hypothetical protein
VPRVFFAIRAGQQGTTVRMCRQFVRQIVLSVSLLALGHASGGAATDTGWLPRNDVIRIQALVDELLVRLAIPQPVSVVLVQTNPMFVSVESLSGDVFRLSLEDTFIDALSDEELRGVLAHELGHVWIFTHHPFLQTEQLANRVAMRVVSRETLERVYGKVWERSGAKGDLVRFLGH